MNRHKKPLIFIGSSTEGLAVARTVEELLYNDASIELWTSDVFRPGGYPLDALMSELDRCDCAAFIITPDDITQMRGDQKPVPRDNVVFEAGLFMGRLGRHRTFLIYDKEQDMRLPSDLKGLTLLPYSHRRFSENPPAALGPTANQIRAALKDRVRFQEIDLIKAYIRFIHPSTSLTDTYCRILNTKLDEIRAEINRLEANQAWHTLIEVKIRLREYFEYSGSYHYGAECGKSFVRALRELGDDEEAEWTAVKQVAYMSILAGEHQKGREDLQSILTQHQNRAETQKSAALQFYCNRYLGISFQREERPGNLIKAKKCFDEAQKCIDVAQEGSRERREMEARLLGNRGNLELDAAQPETALTHYGESLRLFIELDDPEHIGIANLQIGQAMIASGQNLDTAMRHLAAAEGLFIELGHIELQGRVDEQRANLYQTQARNTKAAEMKRQFVSMAMENANRARRLFKQTDSQKQIGAIENFIRGLLKEFPDVATERGFDAWV